jgi:hypothetical protein
MKKFFAVLIASCLLLSFSVQAFADELPYIDLDGDGVNDFPSDDGSLNYYYLRQITDLRSDVTLLQSDVAEIKENIDGSVADPAESVQPAESDNANSEEVNEEVNPGSDDDMILQSVDVYSASPITSDSTTGLKSVVLGLIGSYDTIVTDYTYNNNNGYVSHTIEVQPDYVWMGSFLLLCLILYCLFRLGGAMIGSR